MRHTSTILGIAASCVLALSCLLAFPPGLLAAGQVSQTAMVPAAQPMTGRLRVDQVVQPVRVPGSDPGAARLTVAQVTQPLKVPANHPVTGAVCAECHESESKTHVFHGECTTCHVNAKTHAAADSPRKESPGLPKAEQCLACHQKDSARMNFKFSDHHRAGVACADCHGVHAPKALSTSLALVKADQNSKLCATCHKDVLAKFNMPSHHPVQEGGIACVGCHDPHSSKRVSLANNTEQCLTCHQRLRGPFAFEHVPVAEDCANCHDPHGAPNRRLLVAAQPMLCLQCHSLPNNRHGQSGSNATTAAALGQPISGALLRSCTNCHKQVHGSTQDEHLRY